jgi:hypothetical protein
MNGHARDPSKWQLYQPQMVRRVITLYCVNIDTVMIGPIDL